MKRLLILISVLILCTSLVTDKPTPIDNKCKTDDFMNAVAFKESRMRIDVVNTYGMLGKYQFSRTTLNGIGFKHVTSDEFLKNESIQDSAMIALMKENQRGLKRQIKKYVGKTIDNIYITESGILAAAHLAGAGSVRKWFRTKGKKTRVDGYGTSIEMYMSKFANYKINI